MVVEGLPIIKKATLIRRKLRFGPKNVEKTGFLVFFVETPEKRFAILLYLSDETQTYRIAVQLVVEGVPIMKKATLSGKKYVLGQKLRKNGFFGVFRRNSRKTLRNFAVLIR